jgi:hypothetical protein
MTTVACVHLNEENENGNINEWIMKLGFDLPEEFGT